MLLWVFYSDVSPRTIFNPKSTQIMIPTSRPIARNELRCPSVNLRPKTSLQVAADNWLIIAIKRVLLREWISASARRVNDSYCVSLRHSVGQVRTVPILSSRRQRLMSLHRVWLIVTINLLMTYLVTVRNLTVPSQANQWKQRSFRWCHYLINGKKSLWYEMKDKVQDSDGAKLSVDDVNLPLILGISFI